MNAGSYAFNDHSSLLKFSITIKYALGSKAVKH